MDTSAFRATLSNHRTSSTILWLACLCLVNVRFVHAKNALLPTPPRPEPIAVTELPLPPVTQRAAGSCTAAINPHRTGCIDPDYMTFQSGSFLPDGHHVLALVQFVGAPAAPDPASIYDGGQLIIVKTDGGKFTNGDPWKCLTCAVPAKNAVGTSKALDYPQSFLDGKRVLAGTNILDCSPYLLTDDRCNANALHVFPIRWNDKPDGSGTGGHLRELRLHPDNIHLGFNGMSFWAGRSANTDTSADSSSILRQKPASPSRRDTM